MKNSIISASMTKILVLSFLALVFFACEKNSLTESTSPEGTTKGVFSVSSDRQVRFSKGNLQYQASTDTWRFAEHQYDFVGDSVNGNVYLLYNPKDTTIIDTTIIDSISVVYDTINITLYDTIKYCNNLISEKYNGWIDLFGFGTSGYKNSKPTLTTSDYNQYGNGAKSITGTDYDWGRYNKISNGGNVTKNWRTLTSDEWKYLALERPNADKLRGASTVYGVVGYIFLPDDYTHVKIESSYPDSLPSAWAKMEENGAIFLPCAGYRYAGNKVEMKSVGRYWSTSVDGSSNATACGMGITPNGLVFVGGYTRSYGQSVRLVQDVK